jgi:hypothetical protein
MHIQDAEHLCEYLDGRLNDSDAARVKARLASDAGLRRVYEDLLLARNSLQQIPRRRVPRSFVLSQLDPRVRAPLPRSVPFLRYAGAILSLFFIVTVAADALAPLAVQRLAAAPAYGVGGGVGNGSPEAGVPSESLAAPPSGTLVPEALPAPQDMAALTAEALSMTAPPAAVPTSSLERGANAPFPAHWVLLLGIIGFLLLGFSWFVDRYSQRRFRSNISGK